MCICVLQVCMCSGIISINVYILLKSLSDHEKNHQNICMHQLSFPITFVIEWDTKSLEKQPSFSTIMLCNSKCVLQVLQAKIFPGNQINCKKTQR